MRSSWTYIFYKVFAGATLLCLFFVAGGGISHSDRWKIKRVNVVGANVVDNQAIIKFVQEKLTGNYYFVYARENGYLFPKHEVEEGLIVAFPRLKSAQVSRTGAHTLAVSVSERTPFALWCGDEYTSPQRDLADCWFIDDGGFVFDRAPIFSSGVYLEIYGALDGVIQGSILRAHLPRPRFSLAHAFEQAMKKELGGIARISIKPEGEYSVAINTSSAYPILKGVEVRFNDGQDPQTLVKNLTEALPVQFPPDAVPTKKLNYIDLRFRNKVFFGFES